MKAIFTLLCSFVLLNSSYAQPGTLDPTFGVGGVVITAIGANSDFATCMAIQADGKIVLGGYSNTANFTSVFAVARYNTNGTPDLSFNGNGIVKTPIQLNDVITSLAVQNDGKIVAAGNSSNGSKTFFALARYNPDGSLDATFGNAGKVVAPSIGSSDDELRAVAIQTDGKIVAAGKTTNGGNQDFALVRYTSSGSPDLSFDGDGKLTTDIRSSEDGVYGLIIQSDGKIVVAGDSNTPDSREFGLARYNTDGSLDVTFSGDGKLSTKIGASTADVDRAYSLAQQADGKIVVCGYHFDGNDEDFAVIRYNNDGTPDPAFGANGKSVTSFSPLNSREEANSVAIQNDGKIIVAGFSGRALETRFAMERLNPNGGIDLTFGNGGQVMIAVEGGEESASAVKLCQNRIYLAGRSQQLFGKKNFALVAFQNNDANFPTVTSTSPASVSTNGATINGIVSANGSSATARFDYGLTTAYGSLLAANPSPIAGSSATPVSATITSLAVNTQYHYRAVALNASGTTFGSDVAFYTLAATPFAPSVFTPTTTTLDVSLNSSIANNPNPLNTLYAIETGGLFVQANGTLGPNPIFQPFVIWLVVTVKGLTPGTTHLFRVQAKNGDGVTTAFSDATSGSTLPLQDCLNDTTPPAIILKNISINLDVTGHATLQPSDIIQSITDNCAVNTNSFTVSPNTFTCSNVSSGAMHQAYVATTSTGNQDFYGELGLEFTVNNVNGIVISQLGAFDHQGNGITGTQDGGIRVAVFDKTTHLMVPGLDATIIGNADSYTQNYRFKNISPVTLPPGTYVIVAKGYNIYERNGNAGYGGTYPAGDANGNSISFGSTAYYGENIAAGFSFPNHSGPATSPVYLAGSFNYSLPVINHNAYISATANGNQDFYGELGTEFIVNAPGILISQLGAFDDQGNGITGTQSGGVRVAIFNRNNNSIVPNFDAVVVGNGDSYSNNYRFKNIIPTVLPAGDYVVVAKGYNLYEKNGNLGYYNLPPPAADDGGGLITFSNTAFYGENVAPGFAFPNHSGDGGRSPVYLAGNFNYTSATAGTSNVVTVTASDIRGNTATTTAHVTVLDPNGVCRAAIASRSQALTEGKTSGTGSRSLQVYPNPTTGVFTVQLTDVRSNKITIQVCGQDGKVVQQKTANSTGKSALAIIEFNLGNQPAGMYYLKVISDKGVLVTKVILQH